MENNLSPITPFISGGYLGDFIHSLFAVKHICKKLGTKAELYITDDHSFGGDIFRNGLKNTYEELCSIITKQDYIHSFNIYKGQRESKDLVNLNVFRQHPNLYKTTWTKIMCDTFELDVPNDYAWINFEYKNITLKDYVVIHRSNKSVRYDPLFNWDKLFREEKNFILMGSDDEYDMFPYKDKVIRWGNLTLFENFTLISSCKKFIGNQSSPFAIANSLDVPRILEVSPIESNFYLGEREFSKNISYQV